jgi:hypothetical protein
MACGTYSRERQSGMSGVGSFVIVSFVAGIAVGWSRCIIAAYMTVGAVNTGMPEGKRKFGMTES